MVKQIGVDILKKKEKHFPYHFFLTSNAVYLKIWFQKQNHLRTTEIDNNSISSWHQYSYNFCIIITLNEIIVIAT